VQRFVGRPKGLLRVSAPAAFGRLQLAPILPEYLDRHPDVSIDLVLSDRLVDLVEERFDIAIQSSPLTPANLIRRHLAPIRWAVCAASGYLQRYGVPQHPDDLRKHNCIFYASTAVRGDGWRLSRKGEETRLVAVSGNFRANNSELVRDAAVRGLGVALLPTFAMWQDITSGALVRVLPDWTPHGTFGTSLTAYFIADRQLTPKIRTLVDFLAERFGRLPVWDRAIAAASPPKAYDPARAERRPSRSPATSSTRTNR
jgi:DNA-binding transcriptional LysR family regulator